MTEIGEKGDLGVRKREGGELNLTILPAGDMTEIGEKVRGRGRGRGELELSILQTGDMMKIGEKVRGRGRA